MEKGEKWLYVLMLILATFFVEMVLFGGMGIGMVITMIIYFACFASYLKIYDKKLDKLAKALMLPISLCLLCFFLYSNETLRLFNCLFLLGLLIIQALYVFEVGKTKLFGSGWLTESMLLSFHLSLGHIDKPITLMKAHAKDEKKGMFHIVGKVLLGMVIAVPLLCVMIGLLASSDAAFNGVLDYIMLQEWFKFDTLMEKMIMIALVYFPLFSFFYGLAHQKKEILKEEDKEVGSTGIKLDFIIITTVMTMICIVYLVYIFSQLAYFVSAFRGILPSDYTFAEYARRGFFESLPITGINLMLIIILGRLFGQNEGNKGKLIFVKSMTLFIAGFALFIVCCAFSKLAMYMATYGLTLWRVYTTWFLALCVGVIILTVIYYLFAHHMSLIKYLFIFFSIMYLGLNFISVDRLVAKQNIALFEKGVTKDLSACIELSSSSIPALCNAVAEDPKLLELVNENYSFFRYEGEMMTTKELLLRKKKEMTATNWQSWNMADHLAILAIDRLKLE